MKRTCARLILLFSAMAFLLTVGTQASAQTTPPPAQIKASAIQIDKVESNEVKLPAEFQMSLYENLIEQVAKTGRFQHVYRDGDRNVATAPDLVTLHSTVTGFKQGSAMARQVTTVAGKTSIKVHLLFTDKDGKSVLERDIEGKVRFFGENLKATYDFAKKAAKVVRENFHQVKPPPPAKS
jgi:hypothetical protein